jgi:hypothetical protein
VHSSIAGAGERYRRGLGDQVSRETGHSLGRSGQRPWCRVGVIPCRAFSTRPVEEGAEAEPVI